MALLLGKDMEEVSNTVMEEVNECIMFGGGNGGRKVSICCMES